MKYTKKLAHKIVELYETGSYGVRDICKAVGINTDTFYDWKKNKPEFSELISQTHEKRLDNLAQLALSGMALLLVKHEYEEVTTDYIEGKPDKDGNATKPKIKAVKRVKKFIMPNPRMVEFVVTNRLPGEWKSRTAVDHTNNGGSFSFGDFLMGAGAIAEPEIDESEGENAA